MRDRPFAGLPQPQSISAEMRIVVGAERFSGLVLPTYHGPAQASDVSLCSPCEALPLPLIRRGFLAVLAVQCPCLPR